MGTEIKRYLISDARIDEVVSKIEDAGDLTTKFKSLINASQELLACRYGDGECDAVALMKFDVALNEIIDD
nr:hypothetical protein [Candidatus Sigynarchaeota archaeon]